MFFISQTKLSLLVNWLSNIFLIVIFFVFVVMGLCGALPMQPAYVV